MCYNRAKVIGVFIMEFWQIFSVIAVIALILEIVVPSAFFLNFAFAGIVVAVLSLFVPIWNVLIVSFIVLSLLSIWLIRPILLRKKDGKNYQTGLDGKYIGKIAKVTETVTKNSGTISIYDERWDARSQHGEEIPSGSDVRIVRNDSLVLYVEQV